MMRGIKRTVVAVLLAAAVFTGVAIAEPAYAAAPPGNASNQLCQSSGGFGDPVGFRYKNKVQTWVGGYYWYGYSPAGFAASGSGYGTINWQSVNSLSYVDYYFSSTGGYAGRRYATALPYGGYC